jgi:hypothetical protein
MILLPSSVTGMKVGARGNTLAGKAPVVRQFDESKNGGSEGGLLVEVQVEVP